MKIFIYLFVLFLLILGISFSLLNANDTTINYLLGSVTLPLSLLITISIVLGAALSLLLCLVKFLRLKATLYQLRKKISKLEKAAAASVKE